MNYKKLGNTDLDVSTICLGTMTWGEQNSQEEGFEQMDYALDNGINFFDVAEMYPSPCKKETYGKTEKVIGSWFKEKKERQNYISNKNFWTWDVLYTWGWTSIYRRKNFRSN